VVQNLPSNTNLSIVGFAGAVLVYSMARGGVVSADAFPGHVTPSDELLERLFHADNVYSAPLYSSRTVAESIVNSLRCVAASASPRRKL
jgi:hypothetical protein